MKYTMNHIYYIFNLKGGTLMKKIFVALLAIAILAGPLFVNAENQNKTTNKEK